MSNTLTTEKTGQGVLDQIILGVARELNNPNAFVRMNVTNLKKMFWLLKPVFDEYEQKNPDSEFGPYSLAELRNKMNQHIRVSRTGCDGFLPGNCCRYAQGA